MDNVDKSLHYISLLKKEFPDRTILQIVYDSLRFSNPGGESMAYDLNSGKKSRNIPLTDSYIEKCLETRLIMRMKDNERHKT